MNAKLSLALKNGTLKPYDLEAAQVGDSVVNQHLGYLEVIAIHGITVVFGEVGESQIYNFSQAMEHSNYLLPLAWLGDAPVYLGDVLYHKNGKSQYVVRGASLGLQVASLSSGEGFTMDIVKDKTIPNATNIWSLTPPFIEINGYKVPRPERKPLEHGTKYFVPQPWSGGIVSCKWDGDPIDQNCLKNGLVHLTKGAARAHTQAIISITKEEA